MNIPDKFLAKSLIGFYLLTARKNSLCDNGWSLFLIPVVIPTS